MTSLNPRFEEHHPDSAPIDLRSVTVFFNGHRALDDVSLEIPTGERIAVVGPNGAGKTTLFRLIAGTLEPSAGQVNVYGHGPSGHVCIAYVPQRSQVDWKFPATVREVVMMGRIRKIGFFRWPNRNDWRFVNDAIARVRMDTLAERQIGELSGGQQQRVFLAQAIAQEAEIVLLDEPLTGLDLPSQEIMFQLLDELKAGGVTVLIATHDLNLAAEHFDQVILLKQRIIAFGPPEEALTQAALVEAYGGHVHRIDQEGGLLVVTDTCCEGDEEFPIHD
ncbi:MAG: metal ABC transporter ATP-binding protein [Anaerolineales bacterium]|nr:MAG: metal ABC transporter ATP-binding protein [Anaerolineales bacterium]